MEAEALEKTQKSYEKAVEEVNKLNEREDVALSSAKQLSDLFSDEDWGAESAKKASEIYNEMADQLEEIGGVEDDRIQQLRDEADNIKDNIKLSKQEREEILKTQRMKFLEDGGWKESTEGTNGVNNVLAGAQDKFWKIVEKKFYGSSALWFTDYSLRGDVFETNSETKEDTSEKNEIAGKILKKMRPYLDVGAYGEEYLGFRGNDRYNEAIGFMKAFEDVKANVPGADSNIKLYKALEEGV